MASSDIKPYPLMFDASQWSNPYSAYASKALPFMGQYAGTPTDAHGNPIASYQQAQAAHDAWQPPAATAPAAAQGTTLNTSPSNLLPGMAGGAYDPAVAARINPGPSAYYAPGNSGSLGGNQYDSARIPLTPFAQAPLGLPRQPAAAAPAAPTNPVDMNAAYLQALSNPGHVVTPGANVAQSPSPSAQSGVLQQFMANWKPGANPAGNYNPSLFPNALRGQV